MAITVNTLINQCNSIVDDTFQPADWIAWFNDGMRDMGDIVHLETKTVIPVITGTTNYDLPDNVKEIKSVYLNGTLLYHVPLDDTLNSGYKSFAGELILQPAPVEDGTLEIYYLRFPAMVSTTADEIDLPNEFIHLLKMYACHLSQQKDDEAERQTIFLNEYVLGRSRVLEMQKAKPKAWASSPVYQAWQVIR